MRKTAALLVVVVLCAVPVAAEEPEWEPNLRTEQVWFVCGSSKVQNTDDLSGQLATWDTTPPEESVTDGAGCGSVDSPLMNANPGNPYDSTWDGDFDGNLDSLTLEVHNIYAGPARATGELELAISVWVDGVPLFGELGEQVVVEPVRSDTGLAELVRFTITDIGFTGPSQDGLHWVTVKLHGGEPHHRGPTVTDTLSGWVWGTTEVPSGIVFNADEPADVVVSAGRS